MSTAPTECVCAHLSELKAIWAKLSRRQQSDVARDVDIITQEPPRRDVYSVTSTKTLSSVKLIERVESRWELLPDIQRATLATRSMRLVSSAQVRAQRNSRNGNRR